jgi:O-phospho-L-seryl-tRNASec:L-selenocysteinyl-tRNA synthase
MNKIALMDSNNY